MLALFKSGKPADGRQRDRPRARSLALTAHRYVATLAALGYLQQDRESKRYRLGPRVLDLGFSAINSMDVREISAPHLQQLSDETGHTVNMAILDGGRHRLHRALPRLAPGPARDRPQPAHRRPPARPTAPRWARRCSRSCPRIDWRRSSRTRARRARPQHDHRRGGVPRRARRHPRDGHRRQRRGAGLRPALDRRADQRALGRGRGGAQPRSPSLDGPDDRSDRALLTRCSPDRSGDFGGDPLTNGCRLLV